MTDPIAVSIVNVIASLAFQEFIKSGAGELGKRFTAGAISKMKDLRGLIQQRLQGNPDAVAAMEQAQNGEEDEISGVAIYLRAEMKKDPDFAAQVQMIVQEIEAGKLQDNSSMVQNNSGNAIGFQTKVEGGTANIGLFGKIPNRE
jgi:hypothetical protein